MATRKSPRKSDARTDSMTAQDAAWQDLARLWLQSTDSGLVLLEREQWERWPQEVVTAMRAGGVLKDGSPARVVSCPGCEQACARPVEVMTHTDGVVSAFSVCDRRDDINRVAIPLKALERRTLRLGDLAAVLARSLRGSAAQQGEQGEYRLGIALGTGTRKAPVLLAIDSPGGLHIHAAGHALHLSEVVTIVDGQLGLDLALLARCVNRPIGAQAREKPESPEERGKRILAREAALRAQGVRGVIKRLMAEEGVSQSRIKQLKTTAIKKASPIKKLVKTAGFFSGLGARKR